MASFSLHNITKKPHTLKGSNTLHGSIQRFLNLNITLNSIIKPKFSFIGSFVIRCYCFVTCSMYLLQTSNIFLPCFFPISPTASEQDRDTHSFLFDFSLHKIYIPLSCQKQRRKSQEWPWNCLRRVNKLFTIQRTWLKGRHEYSLQDC